MAGLLAIGGDGNVIEVGGVKANRFPPMVKFLGPFTLKRGQKKTHEITLPNYVGQVSVMVVAATNRAYGNAQKSIEVKKPLMVLASLPRVVGPGETVSLPVTAFAMEPNIKNVNVWVQAGDLFDVQGSNQTLTFSQTGDQVAYFPVKVARKIGQEKIKVIAEGHGQRAEYEIEIDVRPSNPPVHAAKTVYIDPGQTKSVDFVLPGLDGTKELALEAANGLQLDLGIKGKRLFRYPHGCIEQTTSRAFPQLYLSGMMELDEEEKNKIDDAIKHGIKRLFSFQLLNGGLGYWPNATKASPWGTTYAGHFMLEARKLGYELPPGYLNNWIKYQKSVANNWLPKDYGVSDHGYRWSHELMQAYRLYTLVLADAPQIGAMNRLRGQPNLSIQATWRLALAYYLIGRKEVARDMVANTKKEVTPYTDHGRTFGSSARDQAMILESLVAMEDWETAFEVAEQSANNWKDAHWYSTQSTSYILLSMFKFMKHQEDAPMAFSYAINNHEKTTIDQSGNMFYRHLDIPQGDNHRMTITNNGQNRLFVKINTSGVPLEGKEERSAKNLMMSIEYHNLAGDKIDIKKLKRGTDFIASVTVKNPGLLGDYSEMALTQIFPSGWEIHNSRLDLMQDENERTVPDYQDIRDDRVYTYFNIGAGSRQTYKIKLTATYPGRFYQPAVYCEAMYNNDVYALEPGKWVEVVDR